MFGVPVVTNSCAFFLHTRPRVRLSTRHSLRPLDFWGVMIGKARAESRREDDESHPLRCHAPLQAGHPVFQRPLSEASRPLEYWIARSRAGRWHRMDVWQL